MANRNELTIENSALRLIDHQPWVAFPINSISPERLTNNVTALAKLASALGVPTVLSTINAEGGPLRDPLFAGIAEAFPGQKPIDRHVTNAWADPNFVAAVEAMKRKKLVMAGLWTEMCLAQTAISALKAEYEVYFVAGAPGGLSPEAHKRACQRRIQAGARPMTRFAVLAEWCPDNHDPVYRKTYPVALAHGGGVAWGVQYIMDNMKAPK
jgi:nicotinamidase-related amidase